MRAGRSRGRTVEDMGRILLIVAAVIVGLMLIGPLLGFAFTLVKWGLIIGAVVLGVTFVSRWAKNNNSSDNHG